MIDALATVAAWSLVGGLTLLVVGWMCWPAILAGAKGIGGALHWLESRRR